MCSRQTISWFRHSRLIFRLDVSAGVAGDLQAAQSRVKHEATLLFAL